MKKETRDPDGKDPHWERQLPKKNTRVERRNTLSTHLELNRTEIQAARRALTEFEAKLDKRIDDIVNSIYELKDLLKEYLDLEQKKRKGK